MNNESDKKGDKPEEFVVATQPKQEEKQSVQTTPQDFDKYEMEFQVLDETEMNEVPESEEESSSDSEEDEEESDSDGIDAVPLDMTITPVTPTPGEKQESPGKES